jgi:hypothetical protein
MSDPVHVIFCCISYISDPVHVIFCCKTGWTWTSKSELSTGNDE